MSRGADSLESELDAVEERSVSSDALAPIEQTYYICKDYPYIEFPFRIFRKAAELINSEGFVDEEDVELTRPAMRELATREDLLRQQGYEGGKIRQIGNYFLDYGSLDGMYDSSRYDREEAMGLLEKRAQRYALWANQ